ncbi:MAG: hypothetical protein IPK07_17730 [Deltaproteobacteria bacterium]|nr:hypothetical protein [Deltaproteobacteria bacterium]
MRARATTGKVAPMSAVGTVTVANANANRTSAKLVPWAPMLRASPRYAGPSEPKRYVAASAAQPMPTSIAP